MGIEIQENSIKLTVSTPSGATLIAAISEQYDIWMVTVNANYPPDATAGFVITNIRYALYTTP